MDITERRLFEIILEELQENYSAAAGASLRAAALTGNRDTVEMGPVDDEVIKAILSVTSKKNLNEQMLTEDMKERIRDLVDKLGGGADAIKRVASRLGLATALVASIVAGGATGAYLAGGDSAASGDDIELQVQDAEEEDDVFRIKDIAGSYYDAEQISGMSNQEKLDNAWSYYDLSEDKLDNAPVSSTVWIYKYKMIPTDQFNSDTPLPLVGTTAGDYYNFLKQRVESNPMVELPLLKNQVYGDVGKWAGGIGGKGNFKVSEDGSQILPPDWTVAYTVYADLMEEKTLSLLDYHTDNPEEREYLYESLGVENEEEFNKFIKDTMYKIGRPI